MRTKKLLAAFLLGVGLCFVPGVGYGEVKEWIDEFMATIMKISLSEARINYMRAMPDDFLAGFIIRD